MDCIVETKGRKQRYAKVKRDKKTLLAHRVAYTEAYGSIPGGLQVRHTCDNPFCINPEHLILGTHQDNMRDAHERNRFRKGVELLHSKLTHGDVVLVRAMLKAGSSQQDVADVFDISQVAVSKIKTHKSWRHI